MLWEPVSCGHRYLTVLTHFQALWCFWTLSNYSGAFSRPNSHWRCCRQHAKTRFITQSEPSILPTARAVCRLTCGFIGSFQLVFVITQLVKELPAAALRAGVCYGWSGCTLTDSLGLCKHPAMTVPFCVVRWDDSQKPNSMWSSFFLSFFFPMLFFFFACLEKYVALFLYASKCSNTIETLFWKICQPYIYIHYCWFHCLSILAKFLRFFLKYIID